MVRFWQERPEDKQHSRKPTAKAQNIEAQKDVDEIPLRPGQTQQVGNLQIQSVRMDASPLLMDEILQEKKYTKWLSYDTINRNACFRRRRAGDYLVVNEHGGRKKLKDYLIDEKIPQKQRDQLWLLADGSHILWVVGWRISEAAKINGNTRKILKIHVEEEIK